MEEMGGRADAREAEKPVGFTVGARVAMRQGHWDSDYTEHRVAKVYKNGNFILEGDAERQQWSPKWGGRHAHATGERSWSRRSVLLWDAETDKEIKYAMADRDKKRRLTEIRKRVDGLRSGDVTPEQLDEIEAALPPAEGGSPP